MIAIDKNPGTSNGYAHPGWGGYDFATNNDGNHNPDYIFAMGGLFTNLYNSGDSFATPSDKGSYTKAVGNYAEVAIPWSDLGGKPAGNWGIIMWYSNAANDWMNSSFPSSNPITGTFPLAVTEFQIYGSAGTGILPDEGGSTTPLPVALSSFTGVFNGEVPILQWVTASEINNAGWNVFRATESDLSLSFQVNPEIIEGQGTTSEMTNYQFIDFCDYNFDRTYYYWLESVDYSNQSETYGPILVYIPQPEDENNNSPEVPLPFGLQQNYPNPFNPSTEISFLLSYNTHATLTIYNVQGKAIRKLLSDSPVSKEETYILVWDGKNEAGELCSSGIYFYKLETTREILTKRMLLIK